MAGCGLDLPRYEDLSKEQDAVYDLPLGSSHVVTGPPGSGKTVMAIYRADQLHQRFGEPAILLMFNKLLSMYTSSALKKRKVDAIARTYHSWFPEIYKKIVGQGPPRIGEHDFEWTECWKGLAGAGVPAKERVHIIVDEGQDMPNAFYTMLTLLTDSITVFADENQMMTEQNSMIDQIARILQVERVHHLTRNYRNSRPIAEVAASFHVGVQTGVADFPADRPGDQPRIVRERDMDSAVDRIVNRERNFGTECIGVILPTTKLQKAFYDRLKTKTRRKPQFRSSDRSAQTGREPIDFSEPGVKVISYYAAKGLEFDTIFLPHMQQAPWLDPARPISRSMMFVTTSRARSNVIYQYLGASVPAILGLVPENLLSYES